MAKKPIIPRITDTLWELANTARAAVMRDQRLGEAVEQKREPSKQEIYLDEQGYERPSGIPLAPPIGYIQQPTLAERIREMVKSAKLAQEVADAGAETFEEADDFDVGDDFDPTSPYEEMFEGYYDPGAGVRRMNEIEEEEKKTKAERLKVDRDKMREEILEELKKAQSNPNP